MTVAERYEIRRVDLNDQVYEAIRDRLLRRELGPGQKLSLHTLADEFHVSRSPVHHALTRLVTEGLVEVSRRGYFVKPLTVEVMEEGHDVRLALELWAAEQNVGRTSAEELREFRRLMDATVELVVDHELVDKHAYILANKAFHEFQVDLAHNRLMSQLYRRLNVHMLMERVIAGASSAAGESSEEHAALVEAYEAGDLARAQAVIRANVATGKRLTVEAIKQAGGML